MFDGIDDDVGVSRFRDNNNNATAKRNKVIKKAPFLCFIFSFLLDIDYVIQAHFLDILSGFLKKKKQDHLKKKLEDQEIKNLFFIQQKKTYFFNHLQKK